MEVYRFLFTFLIALLSVTTACIAEQVKSHNLVKRQSQPGQGQRSIPLSRSRQFPPPEELEEEGVVDLSPDSEEETEDAPPPARRYNFRGRQQPPEEEEDENTSEDLYTEAPPTTTPLPTKAPGRISAFNRFANRPRFGSSLNSTARTTPPTRSRQTASSAQRIDVVADILDKPPPSRSASRSIPSSSRDSNRPALRKPAADQVSSTPAPASRRSGTGRVRPKGRLRTRTSTTTTTTTTTTAAPPADEYYYYYYDEEEGGDAKQPIATTSTTTTTTTTAKPPSLPRRPSLNRGLRPSSARSTSRPQVKFDPESQFQPPPEDDAPITLPPRTTKKFTTSSTTTASPDGSGIPPHLRSRYKPRTDGRFVDYLRDPNRPRELKGFDLTNYPFYIRVPEDIEFECDDKKDGYYASVPHHCQLFHYCFAGSRYDFLCANYTLYDQTTFTCRFANNVDCESSASYYYRNDDLWKETTTTTTTAAPEPKKKAVKEADDDYEEEEYDDEYYDDEEEERRPRRPKRRRNRRRKNRRKQAEE